MLGGPVKKHPVLGFFILAQKICLKICSPLLCTFMGLLPQTAFVPDRCVWGIRVENKSDTYTA